MLLLIWLNVRTHSSKVKSVSVQHIECTMALDGVVNKLDCVCLNWCATDYEEHSTVTVEELDNLTA